MKAQIKFGINDYPQLMDFEDADAVVNKTVAFGGRTMVVTHINRTGGHYPDGRSWQAEITLRNITPDETVQWLVSRISALQTEVENLKARLTACGA